MTWFSSLFSFRGRRSRGEWFFGMVFIWSIFTFAYVPLIQSGGRPMTLLLAILAIFWTYTISVQRCHDINRSATLLFFALIPIGPLFVFPYLLFKRGTEGVNRFGPEPGIEPAYHTVTADGKDPLILNDVTRLNPVRVKDVIRITSEEQLRNLLVTSEGPFSIGGGRFSMGGQTAAPDTVHLDMRTYTGILLFSPELRTIRVRSGTRWCDVQRAIAPYGLSVKIMQTYANFTVGGSVSVNSHGRYVGQGPLVLSIRCLRIMLVDGRIVECGPDERTDLFHAVVGGYGAVAIILEVEFSLDVNTRIRQHSTVLTPDRYLHHLRNDVLSSNTAVFHNADVYPRAFKRLRAVTWYVTEEPLTEKAPLMQLQHSYPVRQYFIWAFTRSAFGAWRRQYIYEPLLYRTRPVRWRNVEAGYDVAELEPPSRKSTTYVLQEYFVPIDAFVPFLDDMRTILGNAGVQVLNISIRHAHADPGTLMAWARSETLAFVLYYRQGTDDEAKAAVGRWTRDLIDAVLRHGGTYYLPYQPHATADQFHRAYPKAQELFTLKRTLDPDYKLRNSLWAAYYQPTIATEP